MTVNITKNVESVVIDTYELYMQALGAWYVQFLEATYKELQWDPFITDTFGEQIFGRYTEVAIVEG